MKKITNILLTLTACILLALFCVGCTGRSPEMYTLSFEMNGHGTAIEAVKYSEYDATAEPVSPSESGWRFDGWYEDEELYFPFYFGDTIDEDTTVYAKWTQIFEVAFNTGVSDFTLTAQQVDAGGLVNLPDSDSIKSAGKKFEGWYADAGFNVPFNAQTTPITRDLTIHAKWTPYFLVTFDRNGRGTISKTPKPQEYDVDGSKAVRPEDMSANSYKFLGWSVSQNGSAGLYDFNTVLTDSITLYAQWVRLYNVTFNLNNEEALQPAPDRQSVEDGKTATCPDEPVVDGYKFEGWYTKAEGGEKVDFNTYVITSATTFYAHWTKTAVGTLDVEGIPEVDYNKEAPYGDRPDLNGYVIDGMMNECEGWDDRDWFSTATVDAPTVSYALTTQFSEKGLYLFFVVRDNGGLYNAGNNLSYRNSHLEFAITDGKTAQYHSNTVKSFSVDTYSLYPTYNRAKIAVYIAEGEVNTSISDNKSATMHVEAFITWKDLGISAKPDTVKIETIYKYKRVSSDTIKYSLATPFTNADNFETMYEYVEYDCNGYMKKDAEDAVLGDSPYGTAKTTDWDISHESDENNAYVSSNGNKTQTIFFREKAESGYFEVSARLDASNCVQTGKAGIMVYANDLNYASLIFGVNSETYDATQNRFTKARGQIRTVDNDGKEVIVNLTEVDVTDSGNIDITVLFHNGYFYCIINGKFVYCKFVETLNARVVPALTSDYCEGIRFTNYSLRVFSKEQSDVEIGKYAYIIQTAKLDYLTAQLSSVGVAVDANSDKSLSMTLTNSQLSLTQKQREDVREQGASALTSVTLKKIKKLAFTVNGTDYDITADLADKDNGAKFGEFVYDYRFEGNGTLYNESENVDLADMVALVGRVIDKNTGKTVTADALITTSSPYLGRYESKVQNGDFVVLVPKNFEYKIIIKLTSYRNYTISGIADYDGVRDVGDIELVNNILGGVAYNEEGTLSIGSGAKGWDMTNETNNEIILTTDFDPPTVYFSGLTVDEYQYAKVSVSNITDVNDYSVYEPDPAIGFQFYTSQMRALLGLRTTGLRYRSDCSVWAPVQISGYGQNTCNRLDPTGNTKDTLEIIRINRNLYSWINGKYMGHIVLDREFEGDCAIGVQATIAFYGKIKYSDYEIRVGMDAIAIAKERIALPVSCDDSLYDWDENGDADYSKCYINVDGLSVENENLALAGTTLTLSLSEHAYAGVGYSVSIGSYGSVILTDQNPTANFTLPTTASGELVISGNILNICTVIGRVEGAQGKCEGTVTMQDGSVIAFTTGEDGTFAVGVPASAKLAISFNVPGYVAPVYSAMSTQSGEKDVGTVQLYPSILGGKVKGTQYASTNNGISLGYDVDPLTEIEGVYADVNVTSGDHYMAINDRTYDDFDVTYSLVRSKYEDRDNEPDPAIGINVRTAMGNESFLFFRNGVRIITVKGWNSKIQEFGLMPYNIASAYGERADFRIVRRGNLYVMYYKSASDSEWTTVYTYESSVVGTAGLLFYSTNGTNNHYYIWNVKAEKITSSTIPQDIVTNLFVANVSGEESGKVSVEGGTVIDGKTQYVFGDSVKFKLSPTQGNVVAYLKINGDFVPVNNNEAVYKIKEKVTNVEVAFEKEYATVEKKFKVTNTREAPFDVIAKLTDGRTYEFKNLTADENGYVTVSIREGEFEVWADSELATSKSVKAVISATSNDEIALVLDVLKVGAVAVNGKNLDVAYHMGEQGLRSDGAYTAPARVQQHAWVPATLTSGDFVFSTTVIMSGNPNSIYYAKDNCTGVTFSDGTNRFAIQMWNNGFRVYSGSYDQNKMIEPRFDGNYFYSTSSQEDTEHTLTVARKGTTLKVYVDNVYYMTLNESGYSIINESGSLFVSDAQKTAVGAILANTFGGKADKQIVVGYSTCINTQVEGHLNSAGFKNTSMTNDASEVAKYFN